MGREQGSWSGFAGKPEDVDGGCVLTTAAREAHEESSGVLGDQAALRDLLRRCGTRVDTETGTHFLLELDMSSQLPEAFQGAQAAIRASMPARVAYSPFLEKSCVRWFAMADLDCGRWRLRSGFRADLAALVAAVGKREP